MKSPYLDVIWTFEFMEDWYSCAEIKVILQSDWARDFQVIDKRINIEYGRVRHKISVVKFLVIE